MSTGKREACKNQGKQKRKLLPHMLVLELGVWLSGRALAQALRMETVVQSMKEPL